MYLTVLLGHYVKSIDIATQRVVIMLTSPKKKMFYSLYYGQLRKKEVQLKIGRFRC